MHHQPIILTGFMGSGKTTVAAALGERLKCRVVDLDEVVTATEGLTPKELIAQQGEAVFRDAETRALREVLREGAARVTALGGGAWIVKKNRELIEQYNGISVWLDAPFALCWQRIPAGSDERPLALDSLQAQTLYDQRQQHYALAQFRIEVVPGKSVDEIAKDIANALALAKSDCDCD